MGIDNKNDGGASHRRAMTRPLLASLVVVLVAVSALGVVSLESLNAGRSATTSTTSQTSTPVTTSTTTNATSTRTENNTSTVTTTAESPVYVHTFLKDAEINGTGGTIPWGFLVKVPANETAFGGGAAYLTVVLHNSTLGSRTSVGVSYSAYGATFSELSMWTPGDFEERHLATTLSVGGRAIFPILYSDTSRNVLLEVMNWNASSRSPWSARISVYLNYTGAGQSGATGSASDYFPNVKQIVSYATVTPSCNSWAYKLKINDSGFLRVLVQGVPSQDPLTVAYNAYGTTISESLTGNWNVIPAVNGTLIGLTVVAPSRYCSLAPFIVSIDLYY